MNVNDPGVVAEVLQAFETYEDAVARNDVALLNELFWNDELTLRYGYRENLYGHEAIAAFRTSRTPQAEIKAIGKLVIATFGRDVATCNIDFTRQQRVGRQSQTWARFGQGWKIVAAHVSYLDQSTQGVNMQGQVRRIVTGHNSAGRSVVESDGFAPNIRSNPKRPGHFSTDIWRTHASPAVIRKNPEEPTNGPRKITPYPNGTVLRISTIPPDTDDILAIDAEAARKLFDDMGEASASTFTAGGPHPLIHRTQTIDYAIVLEGELHLVLDEGDVALAAGDVVVQVGTSHAWSNRSSRPARVAFVLIDGRFDDELNTLLAI